MSDKQEHDYGAAVGGFWISPEGVSHPVKHSCEHYETARSLGLKGSMDALAHGWVRITFCSPHEFAVECNTSATVEALKTTAALARHYAEDGIKERFTVTRCPYATRDAWMDHGYEPHYENHMWIVEEDRQAADKLARHLIQWALQKNAEAKLAECQPELADA